MVTMVVEKDIKSETDENNNVVNTICALLMTRYTGLGFHG